MAGATNVAEVALFEISVPELPLAKDQFTARLAVNVTAPFSEANVAEGVTTRPPLVIAAMPVPVAGTRRGDPGWFPLIAMDVVSAATELGLKLTDNVQVAPEGKVLPQVFDTRKSLELPPLTVIPVTDKKVVPILLRVRLLAALVVPTVWFPKLRVAGAIVIEGVGIPVPASVVQVSAAVHAYRFVPGAAVLLKKSLTHLAACRERGAYSGRAREWEAGKIRVPALGGKIDARCLGGTECAT